MTDDSMITSRETGSIAVPLARWNSVGHTPSLWRPECLSLGLALGSMEVAAWIASDGSVFMPGTDHNVFVNTGYGALCAMLGGLYLTRKLLALPKVQALSYISGSILSAFWIAWWLLKMLRVEFANTQYFMTLALFLPSILGMAIVTRRYGHPMFGVVPGFSPVLQGPLRTVRLRHLTSPDDEVSGLHGLIVDMDRPLDEAWERAVARAALNGLQVLDVAQFNELARGRAAIHEHSGRTFVASLPALAYPPVKRAIDVAAAVLLILPVMLVVGLCALAVKMDSRGPVFFRQERAGYRGRVFRVWKLRTMEHRDVSDATQASGDCPSFTRPKDPRVTRVGRVLRRYRFDELPQIINILKGEMSWIGPRPEAIELARLYEREIPYYVYRHVVRPGISGWAQVLQGNVGDVDAARTKLEYDFFYIKHVSFWLDVVIAAKTVRTVLTGFGSR